MSRNMRDLRDGLIAAVIGASCAVGLVVAVVHVAELTAMGLR